MHDLSPFPTGMVRVADYLVERISAHGVDTVFGVPGDFVLKLFQHHDAGAAGNDETVAADVVGP